MRDLKNIKKLKNPFRIKIDGMYLAFVLVFSLMLSITVLKMPGIMHFVGVYLISAICLSIMYMDIFRYKPVFARHKKMLALLGLMLVGTMIFGRSVEYLLYNFSKGLQLQTEPVIIYGIPIAVGAMLVSLLFDMHTAIAFSFIISILSGVWQENANYTFYVFVGSIIAAFSVIRCKKRTDIIKGGMFISLANMTSVFVISLLNEQVISPQIISSLIFAASCGITISAFVSIILPVTEHLFKVCTDITLLELLDLNQPLMKNLMINAPGTYHHSVIVGNLVEAVAPDIGVNPLMARVSAYYHDIGKIKMADYFIENQSGTVSKHEKLTPHMSSLIITSHVKEGLELADAFKLPEAVQNAIVQHHGTSLISYFYQKAKDEQIDPPTEEEYRYPGPKPQTRVAALVMIADAVEAASRVLKDPTPSRINGLIEKIINNIFIDGQLDECELTLKDIHIIKERFAYILTGILHKRVEYPGFNFNAKEEKPKDKDADKGVHKEPPAKDRDSSGPTRGVGTADLKVIEFRKG